MNFEEKIKEFILRVKKAKDIVTTEEATKTSIIMPFFQILGYDIFNPNEFIPEFIADVGIKKGEKVDYAIVLDDEVTILIEAKSINQDLQKHDSQLFRYFGTTAAKFAILTNGLKYKFYTDLDETNKMDTTPFLSIDLLDLKDTDISELKKFSKEFFNIDSILNTASDLKYLSTIEKVLELEFTNPSDEFTKLILNEGVYDGMKTQSVIDKYKPIVKKSINLYINDLINKRLQDALNNTSGNNITDSIELELPKESNAIITTDEELESYYIVRSILSECVNPSKITYKDTASYFGVLYDNKTTKWICRIYLKETVRYITFANENKGEDRYDIEFITDLYKYKTQLIDRLNQFIK